MDRPTPEQARQALDTVERQDRETRAALHPWRFTVVSAVTVTGFLSAPSLPDPAATIVRIASYALMMLLMFSSFVPAIAAVLGQPVLPRPRPLPQRYRRLPWIVGGALFVLLLGAGVLLAVGPPQPWLERWALVTWPEHSWKVGIGFGVLVLLSHPLMRRLTDRAARDGR